MNQRDQIIADYEALARYRPQMASALTARAIKKRVEFVEAYVVNCIVDRLVAAGGVPTHVALVVERTLARRHGKWIGGERHPSEGDAQPAPRERTATQPMMVSHRSWCAAYRFGPCSCGAEPIVEAAPPQQVRRRRTRRVLHLPSCGSMRWQSCDCGAAR